MNDAGRKYLPGVCGGLLGAAAAVCGGLSRGGTGDHVFAAAFLIAMAVLAAGLVWVETRDTDQVAVLLVPIGAAMLIRALCLDHVSEDYAKFLSQWYRYFQENGGFGAT